MAEIIRVDFKTKEKISSAIRWEKTCIACRYVYNYNSERDEKPPFMVALPPLQLKTQQLELYVCGDCIDAMNELKN